MTQLQSTPQPTPYLQARIYALPVSVNRMYAQAGTSKRYLSPEARKWKDAVWNAVIVWRQEHGQNWLLPIETLHAPLRVGCTFYGVKGDADNYLKLTLDGIMDGLVLDDRAFVDVTARVERETPLTGALIEVWQMPTEGEKLAQSSADVAEARLERLLAVYHAAKAFYFGDEDDLEAEERFCDALEDAAEYEELPTAEDEAERLCALYGAPPPPDEPAPAYEPLPVVTLLDTSLANHERMAAARRDKEAQP